MTGGDSVIESGLRTEEITMPPAYSKKQQIIDDITRQIRAGELQPGAKLPSARELRERYGSSITPIREAIEYLKATGLLVGVPGVGVFVTGEESDL